MGRIRSLARRALLSLSRRVGEDGLFERPGEAGPPDPPLPRRAPPAPTAAAAPARAPASPPAPPPASPGAQAGPPHAARGLSLPWDRPAGAVLVDVQGAKALVAAGGGLRLVNHWATWCIPCVEELPLLRALASELSPAVATLGISWDLFDPRGDEEEVAAHVENFGAGHGLGWPSGVLREDTDPEDFFAALDVRFDKVPQTWLVGPGGEVLHREEGALTPAGADRLRAAARAAQA